MTAILIYRLESTELYLKGRWEDGEWVFDKRGFSEIDHIEDYSAEMILDRFSGPRYFAVREAQAPLTIDQIPIETQPNAVVEDEDGFISDFIDSKIELAEQYEAGKLNRENYSDEEWKRIEEYADEFA